MNKPEAEAVFVWETSIAAWEPHPLYRGYAVDDEEDTEGVVCIGTCVFDRTGNAIGAISITGLKQHSTEQRQEQLAEMLIRHADQLSRQLGGLDGAHAWALRRTA